MNLVFCTHTHAAATSGTTGPAEGLSTDIVIQIVVGTIVVILGIVATIPAIIAIIAGVYRFKQRWKKRGNGRSKLFIRKPCSQISLFCCCW